MKFEGEVAVEHKSCGRSLAEAEAQALDYLDSVTEAAAAVVQVPRARR